MRIARVRTTDGRVVHATPAGDSTVFEELTGSWDSGFRPVGRRLEGVSLLAPVEPAAIYAIGLNYRDHAAETGAKIPSYPVLFFKNPRSATGSGQPIVLPRHLRSDEVDYEAELAVILARDCRNATPESAMEYVAGFTCANDVSARDWQLHRSGGQWCRAKSFDSFCPLGPWIVTSDDLPSPLHLPVTTRVNGCVLQESNTSELIFTVPEILSFLSADTTLAAGSVILTGTPPGVGMARRPPVWLCPGDEVCVEIGGIGELRNPVIEGTA